MSIDPRTMKPRSALYFLVLALVFSAGCLLGWLWRDNWPGTKVTVTGPAAGKANTSDQVVVTRFSRLLAEARFSEAMAIMSEVPNPQLEQQRDQVLTALADALDAGQCDTQQQLLDAYLARFPAQPAELVLLARCQILRERYAAGIDTLNEAIFLTGSEQQLWELKTLIAQTVNTNDSVLRERGQWAELDYFYQLLLVGDPGNSQYYQNLANARHDSGDLDGAVSALLQIQYDQRLGRAARQQLAKLQEEMNWVRQQARVIPLQGEGVRLIVPVVLDGDTELKLLVDTGAAMSVIEPETLLAMGYELMDSPLGHFQTANGERNGPVVWVTSLAVDDLIQSELQVGSMSLGLGAGVDGLLGMNYLQHYLFSIDYRARLLYLAPRH